MSNKNNSNKSNVIYVWKKNQVLTSTRGNLYLDDLWSIQVWDWSREEQICKDYKLINITDIINLYGKKKAKSKLKK